MNPPFPCISEAGYLDSPEFLKLALHITTAISTPAHVLGLYFLLFKTPDYMKPIKWYLVNLHTWIVLFDYSVGILTVPIILLPTFAGYPFGLLRLLGVPIIVQALVVLTFLAFLHISNLAIFENRFHIICDYLGKTRWTCIRAPWIPSHYIFVILILAIFGWYSPDQNFAVEHVLKSLPCLPDKFYNVSIFVLAEDHTYHLIVIVFFIAFTSLEAVFFVAFTIWSSVRQLKIKRVSPKTYQMQKTFFMALLIQLTVPTVMIVIPMIYAWVVVVQNYHNQAWTNCMMIVSSLHGFLSTVVMLLAHRPYREELVFIFMRTSGNVSPSEAPCNPNLPVIVVN